MDPDVTFLNYSEPWTCTPYKQKAFTSILNPMGSQFYDITEQNNTYYSDLINRTFMLLVIGDNYKKLQSFKELKKGWNGYDGEEITDDVIYRTESFLFKLDFSPKIFPTGRNSVQIEHYQDDDNLVELEIFSDKYSIYLVENGEEREENVSEEDALKIIHDLVEKKS
ncbi:MAG: hypothetical protein ACOX2D_07800 [Fermentimonas sp.]|jgi:hypothetical protein